MRLAKWKEYALMPKLNGFCMVSMNLKILLSVLVRLAVVFFSPESCFLYLEKERGNIISV